MVRLINKKYNKINNLIKNSCIYFLIRCVHLESKASALGTLTKAKALDSKLTSLFDRFKPYK